MSAWCLAEHPIHLGRRGSAEPQPAMAGSEWFEAYGERTAGDGPEGRLVSEFAFDAPWPHWEMHSSGAEVVLCLEGQMTLRQELASGDKHSVELSPGDYAINPPGAWHIADCDGPVRALFITSGAGTLHRPR